MSLLLTAKVSADSPKQKFTYSFQEIGKLLGKHRHSIATYHDILMVGVPEYRNSFKRNGKYDRQLPKTNYHFWAISKINDLFNCGFKADVIKEQVKANPESFTYEAFKHEHQATSR